MFNKRKVAKYEPVISHEFEQYIKKIINPIEFEELLNIGDKNVNSLEQLRYSTTRSGIINLYQSYMMNPAEKIIQENAIILKIDAVEFEKIIYNLNISILNITLQSVCDRKKRLYEPMKMTKSALRRRIATRVCHTLNEYIEQLEKQIKENQEYIQNLIEGQNPIYDFDSYQLTYRKNLNNKKK